MHASQAVAVADMDAGGAQAWACRHIPKAALDDRGRRAPRHALSDIEIRATASFISSDAKAGYVDGRAGAVSARRLAAPGDEVNARQAHDGETPDARRRATLFTERGGRQATRRLR
ncbi:hypothetical protein CJO75_24325 (plasmid) [Ralstonia solanacearum]|nr:hypothetical protein CJO75_24325 [Ralstonia solanacearum]BEU70308.1 hypothetical protein MAFF301069_48630 [Ralstonia pseudosolanacearum]AXW41376.1 hypothetical protein CJO89_24900 [Ralstonia solanacearum]AXW74172.1 hypothetical protein CJO96_24210 [Ralstonia solanacearum]BCL95391.1 hypothetical protein MAFF211479_50930 [Ralstonia solanacearum]